MPLELVRKHIAVAPTALAVVGHQPSDGAVAQPLCPQPPQEAFCVTAVANGLSIPLQQPVGVDGSSLALGLCPHPQRLQQPHLLPVDERLIRHQGAVKGALAVIAPDLGGDGVGFSDRHGVTPATQAVDEGITPINPHPHLQAAVVVSQRWWFLQGVPLLLTPGLRLHH